MVGVNLMEVFSQLSVPSSLELAFTDIYARAAAILTRPVPYTSRVVESTARLVMGVWGLLDAGH